MKSGFIAYIDESGDEGFTYHSNHKSSQWLILSAVVVRRQNDHSLVAVMDDARTILKKPARYTVHFRDLKHEQKVAFAKRIAKGPLRGITIACHKSMLNESEYLREKNRLYFYLTRYLLERLSWICRDNKDGSNPNATLAEIVFSNRSNMSYDEIRNYLELLKLQSAVDSKIQICWDAIDPDQIKALPHNLRAGLQIVDAVASSWYNCFENGAYGFTEHAYAKAIHPIMYRRSGTLLGYGLKLWPGEAFAAIRNNREYDWLQQRAIKKTGPGPEDPTP